DRGDVRGGQCGGRSGWGGRISVRRRKRRDSLRPGDGLKGSRSWRGVGRGSHKVKRKRSLSGRVASTSGKENCRDGRDLPERFHGEVEFVGDGIVTLCTVGVAVGTLVSVGAVVGDGAGVSVAGAVVDVGCGVKLGVAVLKLGMSVTPGV